MRMQVLLLNNFIKKKMKKSILVLSILILTISNNFSQSFRIRSDEFIQIGYDTYKALSFGIYNGTPNNGQWVLEHYDGGFNICKPWPSEYNGNYKLFIRDDNGRVGIGDKPLYGKLDIRAEGASDGISLYNNTGGSFRIFRIDDNAYITRGGSTTAGLTIASNGYIGINRSPSYWLDVNGSIRVNSTIYSSDGRLKKNIVSLTNTQEKLKLLNGISYYIDYDNEFYKVDSKTSTETESENTNSQKQFNENRKRYGFIAQEVKEIFPELVYEDENGILGIDYISLIPILIGTVNEMDSKFNEKDDIIADLENRIIELEKIISGDDNKLKSVVTSTQSITDKIEVVPVLYQNSPNPFDENTTIQFFVPEKNISAILNIYDMQGTQLKSISLEEKGNGKVTINGSDLHAGIYLYSLIVDGEIIDTKQMVLTD